jgi:hypothetical protein
METRNLLIFAAGVTVGYFVFRELNKKNLEIIEVVPPPAPSPGNIDPKLLQCQAELDTQLQVIRTADIEGFKTQFMADCMAGGQVTTEASTTDINTDLGL